MRIFESVNIYDMIIIFLAGVIGGVAISLLEYQEERDKNEEFEWGYFWGKLILGGISAIIVYCWFGYEIAPLKRIGTALLAGVGGSHIIATVRERIIQTETIENLKEIMIRGQTPIPSEASNGEDNNE